MKKVISLVMAVVILFGLFTGYKVVYAAESDLSDYEKEIINAYLYSIHHRSSKWLRPYTYEGIKYDFVNCKEEKLNFNYNKYEENLSPDGGAYGRFIYTSYEKKYDVLKKMDYLAIDGLLILQDHTEGNTFRFENVHQAPSGKDGWGACYLPQIIIYRVTLGIYIKEIDGTLYAYGEKYKYKDISEKDIVTPDKLTEEEYINFASWVRWEYESSTFKMEDMYGLENPSLKKWGYSYADGFFICLENKKDWEKRYLPAGWLEGVWNEYNVCHSEDHENPDLTGTGCYWEILKK